MCSQWEPRACFQLCWCHHTSTHHGTSTIMIQYESSSLTSTLARTVRYTYVYILALLELNAPLMKPTRFCVSAHCTECQCEHCSNIEGTLTAGLDLRGSN